MPEMIGISAMVVIIVDIIKWFIPDGYKKLLPIIAIIVGILLVYIQWEQTNLWDILWYWFTLWAGAIGMHEATKITK